MRSPPVAPVLTSAGDVAPAGSALVLDAGGRTDGGYFGELAAIEARERGLEGLVIDGSVRDGRGIAALGFPVFHLGFDGVLVVAPADWPEVEAAAREIERREEELRAELRAGRRLADLLGLP